MKQAETQIPSQPTQRRLGVAAIFLPQIIGLLILGWWYRESLNTDAVAYLRLAHYYAEGKIDLAISGNWGPMLSWLLAPLLKVGIAPMVAGRLVMGLSAVWFLWSAIVLFRAFDLPEKIVLRFALVIAALTLPWSIENITPDLLVGGFICLGVASVSTSRWLDHGARACLSGFIWGCAYLAKAIAFPLGLATLVLFGFLWSKTGQRSTTSVARATLLALVAAMITSAPWIVALSAKYGRPTFSTTRAMMHAVSNPHASAKTGSLYLGTELHAPAAGRITIWEDPGASPDLAWSPFSSWEDARQQCRLIFQNLAKTQVTISSLMPAWLPCLAATVWFVFVRRGSSKNQAHQHHLGWTLAPVVILNLLYLPQEFMMTEHRYFFAVAPLVFVALWQLQNVSTASRVRWLAGISVFVTIVVAWGRLFALAPPDTTASHYARELATRFQQARIEDAPYAGNAALPRGRSGLFVAFLMDKPWIGDLKEPTADRYRHSSARIFLTRRNSRIDQELVTTGDFENLDPVLFASQAEADSFPIRAYRLRMGNQPFAP